MATTTCHPVHLHCLLIQYLKNSAPFLKLSTSQTGAEAEILRQTALTFVAGKGWGLGLIEMAKTKEIRCREDMTLAANG